MGLKDAAKEERHDACESGRLRSQESRVGHEYEECRLQARVLSYVGELSQQGRHAAHRAADGEGAHEDGEEIANAGKELVDVELVAARCVVVLLNGP